MDEDSPDDDPPPRLAPLHDRPRRIPPGSPPGTLLADPEAGRSVVRLVGYGEGVCEEAAIEGAEALRAWIGRHGVTWVDVEGLADLDLIRALGDAFGLHDLALEDVVHANQRPKAEAYEDHLFVVTRAATLGERLDTEQVAMFVGRGYVLTFREKAGDCFQPVRERLRNGKGRLRQAPADYLAYALIDAVVDGYFPVLEAYGEALEDLEHEVVTEPGADAITRIHALKRDLLVLRRAIWPQREMLSTLLREDVPFIGADTRLFLRDCYDHAFELMDMVEIYREVATGMVDVYLSSVSNRMNEIMKVLTVIATIFMPLGFIASLYGMNFDRDASPLNMPELGWYWGYPFALAVMAAVAGGLLLYFRRRNWIGGGAPAERGRARRRHAVTGTSGRTGPAAPARPWRSGRGRTAAGRSRR
ncbi:MAG TPA: magnesium/cobalt transporter CorA [Geminicoccaceae bacterium]|nr:magnesium/cobalt transporter CorA [Geminicoccaceae bacterium]